MAALQPAPNGDPSLSRLSAHLKRASSRREVSDEAVCERSAAESLKAVLSEEAVEVGEASWLHGSSPSSSMLSIATTPSSAAAGVGGRGGGHEDG